MALPLLTVLSFLIYTSLADAVVINEIMPNPAIEYDGEWVELYNNGTKSVDLTGWNITDREAIFTILNTTLKSGEFLVLVYNETYFNKTWSATDVKVIEYGTLASNLKLANKGDDISLYDSSGTLIDNYTWFSNPGENISFGRYPDGISWRSDLVPTPGFANQLQLAQENVKLSVYLSSPALEGILYDDLFKIVIENKENCSIKDEVSVRYNITNTTTLIKSGGFTREVGCSGYANTGEWVPSATGSFMICGTIVNSTINETDHSDNSVCTNVTVIANPIALISVPKQTTFGSFNLARVRFNTTYYNYDKARLLIYGKGARVVTDLSWNKIKSYAECQGKTALEVNASKNQTHFLVMPFFIYPNCDNHYSNGDYELALRVCKPASSGFERWIEILFKLKINGKNSALCPEPEIRTKTVYKTLAAPSKKEELYQILSAPLHIHVGEEFEIAAGIINPANETKDFVIYSYVFKGNKLVSEGFVDGKWSKAWNANKQVIVVGPGEKKIITLINRIKAGTGPGTYMLKVRIKGEKDLTREITVLPPAPEIKAKLSCERINNTTIIRVYNLGPAADFVIIAFPRIRSYNIRIGQNGSEKFYIDGESFLLMNNDKILAKCSIAEVLKRVDQRRVVGHFIKRPTQKILSWLSALISWTKSFLQIRVF